MIEYKKKMSMQVRNSYAYITVFSGSSIPISIQEQ